MLSQMPFPPSGNVNDAYFYVEAPWIKDLSKYNMNVDRSMYMDIDKYNGKYIFSMGRVGLYNFFIRFDNESNILLCPQPNNEISIEAYFYVNTNEDGEYYLFAPYGYQSTIQTYLCIFVRIANGVCNVTYGGRMVYIDSFKWIHILASYKNGYLREYVNGELSHEDSRAVTTYRSFETFYFNIGGYPEAYAQGLPGMFRYVRIWNYAKNFDLDKFVPDT